MRSQVLPLRSTGFSNPFKKLQNTFHPNSSKKSLDFGGPHTEKVASSSSSVNSMVSWRSRGAEMLSKKNWGRTRKSKFFPPAGVPPVINQAQIIQFKTISSGLSLAPFFSWIGAFFFFSITSFDTLFVTRSRALSLSALLTELTIVRNDTGEGEGEGERAVEARTMQI